MDNDNTNTGESSAHTETTSSSEAVSKKWSFLVASLLREGFSLCKKWKKPLGVCGVVLLLLYSCGGGKGDDIFLKNLRKGLEARWELIDSGKDKTGSSRSLINVELDSIGDLSRYKFKNKTFKGYAEGYCAALQKQLDALAFKGTDLVKYKELWNRGANERSMLISRFVDEYGLKVASKYKDKLDDLLQEGRKLLEQAEMAKEIQNVIPQDIIIVAQDVRKYETELPNMTRYDLSKTEINFNFYDENGVVVKTADVLIASWPSGSKIKETVYGPDEFKSVAIRIRSWRTGAWETEYVPIRYVNNLHIDIQLATHLPKEFDAMNALSVPYAKCVVTEFSFKVDSWHDQKAWVTMNIGGRKTYDAKGPSFSRGCHIGWKLYNSDGAVVKSGNFHTVSLRVNEQFQNEHESVYGLVAGNYKLVLSGVRGVWDE